ncbi:MAG: ATP-binding protein [Polyangiaceae bacterium]
MTPDATAAFDTRRRRRRWLLSIGIFVVIAVAMATLSMELERSERDHAEQHSQLTAELSAGKLQDYVRDRVLSLEVMRKAMLQGKLRDKDTFEAKGSAIAEQFGGYRAINWIDEQGVIRFASPRSTNQMVLGRSVLKHPQAAEFFRASMRDGKVHATTPLTLFQGEQGFASYIPVSSDGSLGYLNAVFDAKGLIETCFARQLEGTSFRVTDAGQLLYQSPGFGDLKSRTSTAELGVLDRQWTLQVRAQNGGPEQPSHLWVHVISILFAAGVGASVHLALRRASEREREERERRQLAERLQDASKLEAVGQLAGGVAHDFNNLLTVVASNVALLQEAQLDEATRVALDEIETAASRGAELTTQLLAYSRKQVVQPKPVDIDSALTRATSMLRRVLRENIRLELELEPGPKYAVIDPGQLDRALINLALNARDAMPEGGELTLKSYVRGDRIWLEVSDTGLGMSEEVSARAFEPFFTTKPVGKGTGLGLSTVYGVVSQAGGEVTVESGEGQGATFRIWLPVTTEIPEETQRPPSSSKWTIAEHRRVLLVEDDPGVRRGAARALRRAGYEVVEASNGREALARWSDEIEALVTDAVMPELGGKQLIEELRRRKPDLAVVLMSGHAPDVLGDTLSRLDVVYLPKPYSPSELVEALKQAILSHLPS